MEVEERPGVEYERTPAENLKWTIIEEDPISIWFSFCYVID